MDGRGAPARELGSSRPATSVLQTAVEKCAGGYPVTLRYGHRDAATESIRACAHADLLFVGSHGGSRIAGLLLGSVSRKCLAHAPCPVVVVRSEPKRGPYAGRVIVGVDASEHSRAALRFAAEEARLRGVQLDVVHAVQWDNIGMKCSLPQTNSLSSGATDWWPPNLPRPVSRAGPSWCTATHPTYWNTKAPTPTCWSWANADAERSTDRGSAPSVSIAPDLRYFPSWSSRLSVPEAKPSQRRPGTRGRRHVVTNTVVAGATSAFHDLAAHEAVLLETNPQQGLTAEQAKQRFERFGPNTLPSAQSAGPVIRALRQFHHPLIYVLLAAGTITAGLGEIIDSAVIFAVVLVNAVVGFVQESRAEATLESLRSMVHTHAKVVRDGREHNVASEELVPGDLVLLEAGDKVPADLRLLRAAELRVNESALTREAHTVAKGDTSSRPDQHGLLRHAGDHRQWPRNRPSDRRRKRNWARSTDWSVPRTRWRRR